MYKAKDYRVEDTYQGLYDYVVFHYKEIFTPSMEISSPVWTVAQEVGRRRKTIYVTCPDCLMVHKLDRRKILESGVFDRAGCFMCHSCRVFRPYLDGWNPKRLVSTHKPRKLKTPIGEKEK